MVKNGGGGWRQATEETWDEDYGAKIAGAVGGLGFEERPFGWAEGASRDRINRQYKLRRVVLHHAGWDFVWE